MLNHAREGLQLVPLNPRLARDNNADPNALVQLPERDGALVQRVLPCSPAERAGLRRGDLVVAAADQAIPDPATLLALVERASVGEALGLKVVAEGIETAEELELARSVGCDYGQGFGYAPALSPQ